MSNDSFRRCIVALPPDDPRLASLVGVEIPAAGASYRLERALGTGATATTFFATRRGPDGDLPVVVKVTLPTALNAAGAAAALAFRKEAVALGRLSSVSPPSPFVVRLLDVGELDLEAAAGKNGPSALPWLALEYVHGGAEGATLLARVERCVARTGHSFDPRRAERAIRGLASGLSAIHALRVIHRDLTPDNVLCCGHGEDEVVKIAELGLARALGMKETFGRTRLGTPGYAAPEQSSGDPSSLGPWSDVYALGAVVFFLLTGREQAKALDPLAAFRGDVRAAGRATLLESASLHPELRARTEGCLAIDRALAEAASPHPERRPPSAEALAVRLLGALHLGGSARRSPPRRAGPPASEPAAVGPAIESFRWSIVARPRAQLVVRSVAWSGDGRALAVTDRGLAFWDATRWIEVPPRKPPRGEIRFVRATGPGAWLVGSDDTTLARFDGASFVDVLESPDPSLRIVAASGELDDLAALVLAGPDGAPMLAGLSGGRWLEPIALAGVDVVTALARVGESRWLVAGRARDGAGWLALFEPLRFRVERFALPAAPTFLAAVGLPERELGLACGLSGTLAWVRGTEPLVPAPLPDAPPLSAAALDFQGRAWLASPGALYCGAPAGAAPFRLAWSEPTSAVPFRSIYADDGRVLAMRVDGGVLEGRGPSAR
jgi:serine/threonine protein kinase